jgi:hypothetical protein
MAVFLRTGIQPQQAQRSVSELVVGAENYAAGTEFTTLQNNYLGWVTIAERQLRNIYTDPSVWNALHSDRYWTIRSLTQDSPRPFELMDTEARHQAERLRGLADRLKKFIDRLNAAPGQLTVLDTHDLLHYEPPREVDWLTVVNAPEVRLVLPLRVIEELDEKKYTARNEIADRARRVLSQLREQLAATAGAPTTLRDRVTIEVPVDDEPRRTTLDADYEILEICKDLQAGDQPAVLVTGDTGMHIRAVAMGLRVIKMPDKYLRRKPEPDAE